MQIVSLVLQIILGFMFTFLGISALVGSKKALENFHHLKLPTWFRMLTGVVQLIGAIGICIGIWSPLFTVLGSAWIAITMLVGILLHFRVKEPFSESGPALVVMIATLIVFFINT
ncbi:DoxX family protein [Bacillus sp. UNC41MFS5]|uniref:DoxX family protein n=1 Tax=Bacillus sp. UNC41MFS5 TaxID=1449046 RepID=UPI00047C6274|nr:DoxX family protein [Bacillus sp. UNC41MFS5]